MTGDPKEFRHHYADNFGFIGYRDSGKLLDGQNIGKIVHHPAEIIDTIGIWYICVPGLPLAHFFCSAMVKTNIRSSIHDLFTIKFKHNPEHTMDPGMMRP